MSEFSEVESVIGRISSKDLTRILRTKLELDKLDRFFTIEPPPRSYSGKCVKVSDKTSLLLRFETLQKKFPDAYKNFPHYRLLLVFNHQDGPFDVDAQNDFLTLTESDSIDKIVIWSLKRPNPGVIRLLKKFNTDVLHVPSEEIQSKKFVTNFLPLSHNDYDYVVILNKLADIILQRMKKLFHLVLSEIAAPIYNEHYGKDKAATDAVMKFESRALEEVVERLSKASRLNLAIDIGCGTGRHSFLLSQSFSEVHGFDISPKMIDEAERTKRGLPQSGGRVSFSVSDFEYEEHLRDPEWQNKANLVVASFGMGSFIENTTKMLKRCFDWLEPGGYLFLSFYNSNSLLLKLTPEWHDIPLSAQIDVENSTLKVDLPTGQTFRIYCKPFSVDTRSAIQGIFDIVSLRTFPTLMALLPNRLLEDSLASSLFHHVDKELAFGSQHDGLGHYVIVVAQKPLQPQSNGYDNVLQVLRENGCIYDIIEHAPVLSIREVARIIGDFPLSMLKTVVFSYKKDREKIIAIVVLPAEKRVSKDILAFKLEINPNSLKFASEKEVLNLGFPIGGIAPVGFTSNYLVQAFLDSSVRLTKTDWFYTGIGDNQKTLRIQRDSFLRLVSNYADIDL